MRWLARVRRRVKLLLRRADVEREMDDEMRFHLEMEAEELEHAGHDPAEATRRALREFGGLERYKDDARDSRGGRWMDDAAQDIRYALRVLRQSRSFSTVAVLTLALGVGANTAIFSVVRGVLLEPLPYTEPERLVDVSSVMQGRHTSVSPPDFLDWRSQSRSFSRLAAYFLSTTNLIGVGEPERLTQARVSSNFFEVLGVSTQLGRTFRSGEDEGSAPRVAILSDGLWRRRFGADPRIVGKTISLDGFATEIVGIAPASIRFPDGVDLWLTTRFEPRDVAASARGARWIGVVGRLAPDAVLAGARSEMSAIAGRLALQDPSHNEGVGVAVVPLRENIVGDVRAPLLILLGAVGFVMLIACVNVASLSLGRTAAREAEIAVRTALGASRSRIARQLLTESLVLSAAGGVVGLVLAFVLTRTLIGLSPGDLPRLDTVRVDVSVAAFALALAIASGALFGVVPALHFSASALHDRLRAGGRSGSGGTRPASARARRLLVVAEVALAIVLLAGAGLLLRSVAGLRAVDPGFRPGGVSTFTVSLSPVRYPHADEQRVFAAALLDRITRLPGVDGAAVTFSLPLSNSGFGFTFEIRGRPVVSGPSEPRAQVRVATPDYFRVMGIPLLRGRAFTAEDRAESPQVVVISEEAARRYWPNEDPIGQVITTGWGREEKGKRFGGEIVGIVGDVRQFNLANGPTPHIYGPFAQRPLDELTVVMRASSPASTVLAAARNVVRELDDELPIYDARTLDDMVADSVAQRRFYALLLAGFAALALMLAAVGIYGVIAYSVQRRRREIGVRIALGATRERVVAMVMRQGIVLVVTGTAIGLAGAAVLTRLLRGLLFSVTATDPLTFIAAPVLLVGVAVVACVLPARRAGGVDPAVAIRSMD